jgi:hypothetical protein
MHSLGTIDMVSGVQKTLLDIIKVSLKMSRRLRMQSGAGINQAGGVRSITGYT